MSLNTAQPMLHTRRSQGPFLVLQDRVFGGNLWLDLTQQNLYYRWVQLMVSSAGSVANTSAGTYCTVHSSPMPHGSGALATSPPNEHHMMVADMWDEVC